ncbi:MAG: porin [Beijerinckiaceae bacterium]|nr:porin [Beijerinckiaceae bacterium]
MSASAVTSNVWRGFTSLGLAAGGTLFLAASGASAQSNPCAIYGSGFVSLNGTDTCVRIGGRVRVDGVIVPSQDIFGSNGSLNLAPGAPNGVDGPDRAHLRLQGGSSGGMPRTR